METLKEFVKQFCNWEIENTQTINKTIYQTSTELWKFAEGIELQPFSIGTPVGTEKKGFRPSLALLEMLANKSTKKVFVNPKSEWFFLCKRDVLEQGITKKYIKKGICLVQNQKDENLGYGVLITKKKETILKPLLDRGDFLRREKK